jgi:hypothetical protein
MQKVYSRINWENYPSDSTPINETNLNKIDSAVDSIDNRVISIDTTKASKSEVSSLVSEITYDEDTGTFTITKMNGSSFTIDTKLEKIAINFAYDPVNEQIIITLDDGTKQYIDLSALITQYEFLESSTIAFEVDSAGKVSAKIKNASVTEEMLQPNYLADIKVQVAKAEKSQSAAELSETNANASAAAAKASETAAKTSAAAAKQSEVAAKASETAAALSESNAQNYSDDANSAAASASAYQNDAKNSAAAAKQSEVAAKASEANAKVSESAAKESETNANESASNAQEYASGKTNSAKYYYEQCKAISESFAGSLRPMGTVKFAELPALSLVTAGDMYNISDEFVTTTDFKEGAGNTQAAGTNVYKTVDGMWDCLAGSPVTGVKGANETTFRRGNVNITPENIGALASDGNAKDATVTFTQATARTNVASGDKMSILFGKIAKWFTDLKTVAFTGSYNDLNNKPVIDASLSTSSSNAIQNKAVASLVYGKIISTNDDWNDITTGYNLANGNWSADKHAPVGAFRRGYIFTYMLNNFGYQIYITANNRNIYIRNTFNSEWSEWEECNVPNVSFGTVQDVFTYTASNAYLTQSDGYLVISTNGYSGQFVIMTIRDKNGVEVDEIVFPDSTNSLGNSKAVYVPKGMYIYNKDYKAVTDGISTAVFRPFNRE